MRSEDALLLDMLIAARKIMRFLADMNEDEFAADDWYMVTSRSAWMLYG